MYVTENSAAFQNNRPWEGLALLATMLAKACQGTGWRGSAEVPARAAGQRKPRRGTPGQANHGRWSRLRWQQPAMLLLLLCQGSLSAKMAAGYRILCGEADPREESSDEGEEGQEQDLIRLLLLPPSPLSLPSPSMESRICSKRASRSRK